MSGRTFGVATSINCVNARIVRRANKFYTLYDGRFLNVTPDRILDRTERFLDNYFFINRKLLSWFTLGFIFNPFSFTDNSLSLTFTIFMLCLLHINMPFQVRITEHT